MNGSGPVLRDIHVPPASWWPPAPGWWALVLIVVCAAALVAGLWWWCARRAPLRAALREVDVLDRGFARERDPNRLADGASRLLRRVARRVDPDAASRAGKAWRVFVHRYARDPAVRRALDELERERFQAHPALDAPALLLALRIWCRRALRGPTGAPGKRTDDAARPGALS